MFEDNPEKIFGVDGTEIIDNTPIKLFWSKSFDLTYKIMDIVAEYAESNPDFNHSEASEMNAIAWRTRLNNMDYEENESVLELIKTAMKEKCDEIRSRPNHAFAIKAKK